MLIRILAISVLWLCCSLSLAEETVEIPLSEIWGYRLPGTNDIRKLEQKPANYNELTPEQIAKSSLIEQIRRTLSHRNRLNNDDAGTAFVVKGTGKVALENAYDVFTGQADREKSFSGNEEITLVFYTYTCGRYVRLDKISRQGNEITIDYHFESHNTLEMTSHFALIPLQRLSPGRIHVKVNQIPGNGPQWGPPASPLESGKVSQIVCKSFDFQVAE
jgi:hypothetical protein